MPKENNKKETARNEKQDIDIASICIDIGWIKAEVLNMKEDIKEIKAEISTRPTWPSAFLLAIAVGLFTFMVAHFFIH